MIFISDFVHAAGALLGLAIGDALGAPLEGLSAPLRKVREMEKGAIRSRRAGFVTDDTLQALAVADSLSYCRRYDPCDMLSRLLQGYLHHAEYYGPTSGAVFELVLGGTDPVSAVEMVHRMKGGSRSNGSVMRGPPIGIFFSGPDVERVSRACSRLTHLDPVAGDCSAWLNRMVSDLCRNRSRERAFSHACSLCKNDEVGEALGNFFRYEPEAGLDVVDASHAALYIFMDTRSFEEAITSAVNLGGDTDTAGAITGALAGACYGVHAIPGRWVAGLHDVPLVMDAAFRLWASAKS